MMLTQLKVLQVINTINRGGAENHLVSLVKQQVARGYNVTVAYLQGDGYWEAMLRSLGVEVVDLGLGPRRYGDIRPAIRLRSLIRELKPDIVHAHLPPAELYTRLALLSFSSELPLVITKHNDSSFYKMWNGRGHRLLGKWVAMRATRLIAISNAVKRHMCGSGLGCSPQKIVTIHYGIETSPYEEVDSKLVRSLRRHWSVSDNDYLIGTVARLVPEKALHILLEGFAIYLQRATKSSKLVIVGTGPLERNLKLQAIRLGIQDRVIWAGFREDIPVVMNALDLFALSSNREGFGLVLLEAMAASKPVVATRVSAIPEVVEDKMTGILVSPNRPDLFAEAFQFFESKEARASFGSAGWERVQANFTLTRMADRTSSVYAACLGVE